MYRINNILYTFLFIVIININYFIVMSETKTMIFDNGGTNSVLNAIAPLLQRNSIDPGVLALMNNNGGFGNGNNAFWLIFLILLWGGNGFGGFGGNRNGTEFLANQINNDSGRELLAEIIKGNGSKVDALANMLGTNQSAIMNVLTQMQTSLCNLGNTIGLSGEQTRHAIVEGNMQLMAQYANCCCEIKGAIKDTNIALERGFSALAFEDAKQTCEITKCISDNTEKILAGQRAAEMRELQREITERDRTIAKQDVIINNGQQTQMFAGMLNQATAPIVAAIGALQKDVDGVKCKLPETTNVPYSPVVGIPTCVAAQYGIGSLYGQAPYWG